MKKLYGYMLGLVLVAPTGHIHAGPDTEGPRAASPLAGAAVGVHLGALTMKTRMHYNRQLVARNKTGNFKLSEPGLTGGIHARYWWATSPEWLVGPSFFVNWDNAKHEKEVNTGSGIFKNGIKRSYELGLGLGAHYAFNPLTSLGVQASALYSAFEFPFNNNQNLSLPNTTKKKRMWGYGGSISLTRALTPDGRYQVGLSLSHHVYPRKHIGDFGSAANNSYTVKARPAYTSVVASLAIKVGNY